MKNNKNSTTNIKYKILLILFCIIMFLSSICINKSNAVSKAEINIKVNKEIFEKDEIIEVSIFIENNKTSAFSIELYFDNTKLEYIEEIENSNNINNRIIYVWYDKDGGKNAKIGKLVTFKFKAKEEGNVTFVEKGEFYNEKGQLLEVEDKDIQIQIGKQKNKLEEQLKQEKSVSNEKNDSNLQILRLDIEGITPSFNTNIYNYYLTIPNTINKIEILAIPKNLKSTIEITGNDNLKEGINNINIKVTSEDKTEINNYQIEMTKSSNLENANTNLEILAIEDILLNPEFNQNEINYKVEIANETTSVNIFAVPQNEKATIEIIGSDNLKEGDNTAYVIVTAVNGISKKKYKIDIHRRNTQEEIKYNNEQKERKQELKEAYEMQELNANNNKQEENTTQISNKGENKKIEQIVEKNNIIIIIVIIFVIVVLVVVFYLIKNKRKTKTK